MAHTSKKSGGFTVLYRTTNRWHVYADTVTPQEVEDTVRQCKLATMSPWVWFGPPALATWMVEDPTEDEKNTPRSVLVTALQQMDLEQKVLERGMDFVRARVISLRKSIRPSKREAGRKQSEEARRRLR